MHAYSPSGSHKEVKLNPIGRLVTRGRESLSKHTHKCLAFFSAARSHARPSRRIVPTADPTSPHRRVLTSSPEPGDLGGRKKIPPQFQFHLTRLAPLAGSSGPAALGASCCLLSLSYLSPSNSHFISAGRQVSFCFFAFFFPFTPSLLFFTTQCSGVASRALRRRRPLTWREGGKKKKNAEP